MKTDTDNSNYSGSPNGPLLYICNLLHLRSLLIKLLERVPLSRYDPQSSFILSAVVQCRC